MIIAIPAETFPGERRVALAPESVQRLMAKKLQVRLQSGAGVGANDVVNPAAKHDPQSPIYGMPVLNAEDARTVIVLKRSMNPGFATIENELFLRPNTMMLFGDAKKTLTELARRLREER